MFEMVEQATVTPSLVSSIAIDSQSSRKVVVVGNHMNAYNNNSNQQCQAQGSSSSSSSSSSSFSPSSHDLRHTESAQSAPARVADGYAPRSIMMGGSAKQEDQTATTGSDSLYKRRKLSDSTDVDLFGS